MLAEKLGKFGEKCAKEHNCSPEVLQGCPIALVLEQIGILLEAYSTCNDLVVQENRIKEVSKQFKYEDQGQYSESGSEQEFLDRELSDEELMEYIMNDPNMQYYAQSEGIFEQPINPKKEIEKSKRGSGNSNKASDYLDF